MPSLSDFNDPTRYNRRTAAANAAQQDAQRQAQVSLNQSTGQTVGAGMQTAAPVPVSQQLQTARTIYGAQPGQQSVTQNATGQTVNIPDGNIALNAFNRLTGAGQTPDQAAATLGSQQYRQGVQQAFNTGLVDTSTLQPTTIAGVQETPEMFAQRKAAIEAQNAAKMQQQTEQQTQARNLAASNAASAAAGAKAADSATLGKTQSFATVEDLVDHYRKQGTDEQTIRSIVDQYNQQKTPSPEQQGQISGIESLIGTLTPEQRQYLEPMLRAQMQAIGQSNALAGATFGNDMQAAKDNYDTTNAQLQAAADMNVKLQKDLDAISQQMRDSSLENVAKQQKVNEERLQWEQTKRERELRNEERKAVDRKIGEMALIGGFGSYASGQVVDEVRNNFESAISDLAIEFGLQRSEAAVRFSAQHNDIMNQYRADTIISLTTLTAKLEQIGGQFASNKIAKTNAEKKAWDDFVKVQTTNEKEKANLLSGVAKEAYSMIYKNKDEKLAQEKAGWDRLEWAVKTYGSFTPPEILASISKQLPGVDVASLANSMTLAEMKQFKARNGGGGGGSMSSIAFSPSMLSPTGEVPSYEQFVAKKKAELKADTTLSLDQIRAALDPKALKEEYEARKSYTTQGNPSQIMADFERRATMQAWSQPVYKRTASIVQGYIKSGQYELARDVVDGIGDDIDATSSLKFSQALSARTDIAKLRDAMSELSAVGPITGRLRELNPYDNRVVRVNNLITQAVPNLARGVFNEVGVLTDQDRETYTKTLANPKLTVAQAQQATADLMEKINFGMQNQVSVWDAQNKRTAGLKRLMETTATGSPAAGSTQADEDFALSILQGR